MPDRNVPLPPTTTTLHGRLRDPERSGTVNEPTVADACVKVQCPYCQAKPGVPCENQAVSSKPLKHPHRERQAQYLAVSRAVAWWRRGVGR